MPKKLTSQKKIEILLKGETMTTERNRLDKKNLGIKTTVKLTKS